MDAGADLARGARRTRDRRARRRPDWSRASPAPRPARRPSRRQLAQRLRLVDRLRRRPGRCRARSCRLAERLVDRVRQQVDPGRRPLAGDDEAAAAMFAQVGTTASMNARVRIHAVRRAHRDAEAARRRRRRARRSRRAAAAVDGRPSHRCSRAPSRRRRAGSSSAGIAPAADVVARRSGPARGRRRGSRRRATARGRRGRNGTAYRALARRRAAPPHWRASRDTGSHWCQVACGYCSSSWRICAARVGEVTVPVRRRSPAPPLLFCAAMSCARAAMKLSQVCTSPTWRMTCERSGS